MNALKLPKTLPDGLFVQYYAVRSVDFSDNTAAVHLGAWADVVTAFKNSPPDITLRVDMTYTDMSAFIENILPLLRATNDWKDAELIDISEELRVQSVPKQMELL